MAATIRKSGKASTKEKTWKPVIDLKAGHNRVVNSFTSGEVSSIWHATGLEQPMPDGLPGDLNEARARYTVALHRQQKPTPRQLARQTQRIAHLSAKLLDTVSINGELRSGLGAGGLWAVAAREGHFAADGAVKQACAGVVALERWATAMSKHESAKSKADVENKKKEAAKWKRDHEKWKKKHAKWVRMFNEPNASKKALQAREPVAPSKPKGNSDIALNALIGEMEVVYFLHSERSPGLSRDSKNVPRGHYFDFVSKTLEVMGLTMSKEALYLRIKRFGQMTIIQNPE